MNISELFDRTGDVRRDLKRLDMKTTRQEAISALRLFLETTWHRGAWLTGALDYQGYPTPPEKPDAQAFTIAGACRRIMCTYKSGDVCSLISEVNAEVFGVPITHTWESSATWQDVERLLVAAEYISSHKLEASLDNLRVALTPSDESRIRAKERAINQVWRYLNMPKEVAA